MSGFGRRWGLATASVVVLVTASACGSAGGGAGGTAAPASGTAKKDIKIAYANYADNSPLFAPITTAVKTSAAAAGMNAKVYDNKGTAETTLQNAQLMVQDKPDVVIEYSPDSAIGKSLFTVFDRAGSKCIALNVPVEGCPWLNVINKNLGTAAGQMASDYANKNGWTGANTTVLLANSARGGVEVNDTVRYTYLTVADKVPGFTKITPEQFTESTTRIAANAIVVDGGNTLDSSFAAVQAALQNIPNDQNIIYSSVNDDTASGGWRAIAEAGREKTSVVIGEGGSETALKQLRDNPQWIGEVDALVSVWGYYAVAMADALAAGVKPPALTELPFVALTKDTINDYYTDDLTSPKALPKPVDSNKYLFGRGILESYRK
ncbi:hypothetical protein GCM10009836_02910 [Pseudonocardia ailaonensis]|uniref:Periplasmic binding protein domain-containing protein n=1 Tax=Pseudonocardia ailaonensis TaxID=367279 RepID=A0ABN2MLF5_9PSEU